VLGIERMELKNWKGFAGEGLSCVILSEGGRGSKGDEKWGLLCGIESS